MREQVRTPSDLTAPTVGGWLPGRALRADRPVGTPRVVAVTEPSSERRGQARTGLRSIRPDLIFSASVLAAFFAAFYGRWPIWEDQAIYHYMAWGLRHGLVPYRDTINMNWPGIILVHALARAIGGAGPFGLRLLDVGALFLLSAFTARLLAAYLVPTPLRLVGLTSYYVAYFLMGFTQTAQRESFALPLVSAGIACGLLALDPVFRFSKRGVVVCGLLSGIGLSIKPTLGPPLALAFLFPLVARPSRESLAFAGRLLLGTFGAGIGLLAFLALACSPRGFYDWGVVYAFGPYAQTKWPMADRLDHTLRWLVPNSYGSLPVILAATGLVALVGRLLVRKGRGWEPGCWRAPALFVVLTLLIYATVLAQGKTHCPYQFHPVLWALSLTGVVALRSAHRAGVFSMVSGSLAVLCVVALGSVGFHAVFRDKPPTPDGTLLAQEIRPRLTKSDEVVLFGFSPTLLSAAQRRTPFPFVDSWVVLICSGMSRDDRYERLVGQSLAASVAKDAVKCYVLQRNLTYFEGGRPYLGNDLVAKYVPEARLIGLGYQHTRRVMPGGTEYDVWLRN